MFTKRIIIWLILVAAFTMMLISCGAQENELDATSWVVESYLASSGEITDMLPDSTITVYFQAGNVNGNAGCNNYTAAYQTENKSLTIGPASVTRKMCVEPLGVMEQENAFLAALGNVAEYKIEGDTLTLEDKKGDTQISLLRATAQ
jgi:heat shock protein HslJ